MICAWTHTKSGMIFKNLYRMCHGRYYCSGHLVRTVQSSLLQHTRRYPLISYFSWIQSMSIFLCGTTSHGRYSYCLENIVEVSNYSIDTDRKHYNKLEVDDRTQIRHIHIGVLKIPGKLL